MEVVTRYGQDPTDSWNEVVAHCRSGGCSRYDIASPIVSTTFMYTWEVFVMDDSIGRGNSFTWDYGKMDSLCEVR